MSPVWTWCFRKCKGRLRKQFRLGQWLSNCSPIDPRSHIPPRADRAACTASPKLVLAQFVLSCRIEAVLLTKLEAYSTTSRTFRRRNDLLRRQSCGNLTFISFGCPRRSLHRPDSDDSAVRQHGWQATPQKRPSPRLER